jgi:hypothetical protein
MTQNFTTMSQMPPYYYPLALSVKSGYTSPASMSGLKFKLSNTGQSSGYNTLGASFSSASPIAAQTIYYFVLKRPTAQSPIGAYSNMAIYQYSTNQVGNINQGGNMFYGGGDISMPNNSTTYTPLFQVLATATKGW